VRSLPAERARLESVLTERSSGGDARRGATAPSDRQFGKGAKNAFSAVGRLSPDFIVQDGVVPRRPIGEALRRVGEMAREAGLRCANVFHAGDGNLHPLNSSLMGANARALERAEALAGRILRMCIEMGARSRRTRDRH